MRWLTNNPVGFRPSLERGPHEPDLSRWVWSSPGILDSRQRQMGVDLESRGKRIGRGQRFLGKSVHHRPFASLGIQNQVLEILLVVRAAAQHNHFRGNLCDVRGVMRAYSEELEPGYSRPLRRRKDI